MSTDTSATARRLEPAIRRAPIRTLEIYEVSEAELRTLEKGAADSSLLSIGLALLSSAISFTVTLRTVPIESDRTYNGFFICAAVGYVAGLVVLLQWWTSRRSAVECARLIRQRMPTESGEPGVTTPPAEETR